ncbi:hypothetical protein GBB97_10110 [Bifidobacterium longum]|uniref:Uncharacterized protein n=1 Tax=Bifidobacterium longum TaxID=216816 RepID=A0A6L4U1L7_BIFLN|nr:hypothetical protein GBC45_10515 [Bifidobacterium longum]KAB7205961.1 hypothetical protein GBC16_10230 [Bifidobacterium longum]KAB7209045.1 hypothetical protein GBC22_10195 [Bifidobacterium longum]KAB7211978.1 hypothetical protein GBB97_10110 [Bifidobacterium longum]KAB7216412.1 hypothetical protein GBC26_10255 [Bifidobacterium longum]
MGKLVNGIIAAIATLFIMAGISMPALAATDDTYVPKNDSAGNIFVQDQANVLSAETEKHVYDLNKSWESREDKPQLLVSPSPLWMVCPSNGRRRNCSTGTNPA